MGGPRWGPQGAETRGAREPRCVDSGRAWWRPHSAPPAAGRLGSPAPSPRPAAGTSRALSPWAPKQPPLAAKQRLGGHLAQGQTASKARTWDSARGSEVRGALLPGEPRPTLGQPPAAPCHASPSTGQVGGAEAGAQGCWGPTCKEGRGCRATSAWELPAPRYEQPGQPLRRLRTVPAGANSCILREKKIIKEVRTTERP